MIRDAIYELVARNRYRWFFQSIPSKIIRAVGGLFLYFQGGVPSSFSKLGGRAVSAPVGTTSSQNRALREDRWPREGFDWRTIPIGANELAGKVAAFRRGLDVDEWEKARYAGKPVMFDLGLAHKLYVTLLGPVEALVSDKRAKASAIRCIRCRG